jgi:hypothetical protein
LSTDHLSSEEIVARRDKLATRRCDVLKAPFLPRRASKIRRAGRPRIR